MPPRKTEPLTAGKLAFKSLKLVLDAQVKLAALSRDELAVATLKTLETDEIVDRLRKLSVTCEILADKLVDPY